jgi:hypothetical protein
MRLYDLFRLSRRSGSESPTFVGERNPTLGFFMVDLKQGFKKCDAILVL